MLRWLAVLLAIASPVAAQPCRLALALALDVSGSVDAREYRLQTHGIITALENPQVRQALFAQPPVALFIYEWSGTGAQRILLDWTLIENQADLAIVLETLRQVRRQDNAPGTAIGEALLFGMRAFKSQNHCASHVIDISSDGYSNQGPEPAQIKPALNARGGITVNALVIGTDRGRLVSYFRKEVITGPDAFIETARVYEDYTRAITRKLARELGAAFLSSRAN